MPIDHYEIRAWVEPDGRAAAGSVTTILHSDERWTTEVLVGPFDTWQDLMATIEKALDIQLTLW